MADEKSKTYNKDDDVPEDSYYVCVPCGYHHHYKAGEKFGECISCLAGTQDGPEEFAEGLELWEKLENENTKANREPVTTENTENR